MLGCPVSVDPAQVKLSFEEFRRTYGLVIEIEEEDDPDNMGAEGVSKPAGKSARSSAPRTPQAAKLQRPQRRRRKAEDEDEEDEDEDDEESDSNLGEQFYGDEEKIKNEVFEKELAKTNLSERDKNLLREHKSEFVRDTTHNFMSPREQTVAYAKQKLQERAVARGQQSGSGNFKGRTR